MEKDKEIRFINILLGDEEDISNRKRLANLTFNKLERIWLSKKHVSNERRIKLYNVLVKSILLV